MKALGTLSLILMTGLPALAQERTTLGMRYRFDNEFYNVIHRGSDLYYTQGFRFDLVYGNPGKKRFTEFLLIPLARSSGKVSNMYSVGMAHQIYTPQNQSTVSLLADRPFAGVLFLSNALESVDSVRGLKLTTEVDLGIIGPYTFAEQAQAFVHKLIHNVIPVGWSTQMRTDIIFNYLVSAEQVFWSPNQDVNFSGKLEANVGTLYNTLGSGFLFQAGRNYGNFNSKKKFGFQFFVKPEFRFVFQNSLLRGGLLTHERERTGRPAGYVLHDEEPLVLMYGFGFKVRYQKSYLMYTQNSLTKEFLTGAPHYYSSVTFYFNLK